MPPAGVIFDLDGTLGDTLPVTFAAFRALFQRHLRRTYQNREILAMFGPSEPGVIRLHLPDRVEPLYQEWLAVYEAEHRRCPRPFAGIPELLERLAEQGVPLGVVTGKGPDSAAISLQRMGLANYFDAVEAGSANGAVKPAGMRRLCERWGVDASQVVSVGDSPSDIRAAREVGATPVAVAWASTADRTRLEEAGPERLFDCIEPFAAWLLARGDC